MARITNLNLVRNCQEDFESVAVRHTGAAYLSSGLYEVTTVSFCLAHEIPAMLLSALLRVFSPDRTCLVCFLKVRSWSNVTTASRDRDEFVVDFNI